MKNKSIITISTINGTKAFHIYKWHTHVLKGTGALLIFVLLGAAFNFSYFTDKFDDYKTQETKLKRHSSTLQSTIQELNSEKLTLQRDLLQRDGLINEVSVRLDELELYLNTSKIKQTANLQASTEQQTLSEDFSNRLNMATVNSAIRITLLRSLPNGSPVKEARLSSRYGKRIHPITKKKRKHNGLDFAVNTGTPIYATADGVVHSARKSKTGSGNFLSIQHDFGFASSFSHLKSFKVKAGELVEKGQLIAISGNTGASSGPHLHYEVRFVGRALDPLTFVKWDNDNFDSIFQKEKGIKWEFLVKKVEQQVSTQLQLLSQVNAELLVQSN
jgi:murein DD-endopeptidase MepM/ murein hydrolase activator NlpD